MLTALFKKPTAPPKIDEVFQNSEGALHDRMNRMLRQNLAVVWTPPPMHPPMTAARAIAEALRDRN